MTAKHVAHASRTLTATVDAGKGHPTPAQARAAADAFVDSHPLYGAATLLPKTAQAIKDRAQQISDGFITPEEGDAFVRNEVDVEMQSLDPKDQEEVQKLMLDGLIHEVADAPTSL